MKFRVDGWRGFARARAHMRELAPKKSYDREHGSNKLHHCCELTNRFTFHNWSGSFGHCQGIRPIPPGTHELFSDWGNYDADPLPVLTSTGRANASQQRSVFELTYSAILLALCHQPIDLQMVAGRVLEILLDAQVFFRGLDAGVAER